MNLPTQKKAVNSFGTLKTKLRKTIKVKKPLCEEIKTLGENHA